MGKELQYFASSPKELEKFRGKHIALIGRKVVAWGSSAKKVLEEAKKRNPSKKPVLAFVPEKGLLVL